MSLRLWAIASVLVTALTISAAPAQSAFIRYTADDPEWSVHGSLRVIDQIGMNGGTIVGSNGYPPPTVRDQGLLWIELSMFHESTGISFTLRDLVQDMMAWWSVNLTFGPDFGPPVGTVFFGVAAADTWGQVNFLADGSIIGQVEDGFNCGAFQGQCVTSIAYTTAVPEPSTLSLLGVGLLGLAAAHRRRRRQTNALAA